MSDPEKSDLEKIQRLFQGAVMGEGRKYLSEIQEFLSEIKAGGKITPARRLHIYQHAYKARLRDILAEDFPVLHSMLGDEAFYELCNRYIDAYPSSHPSLRYFGQHMAKFVTDELPYKDQPVIREMVHFEWAFHDVFDAADHGSVTVEAVAALPPEVWTTLRFEFHPSLHISTYDWNVPAVWSSVQAEESPPVLPARMPKRAHVIQWRYNLHSYFRSLSPDEARALRLAMDKKPFPEICESLALDHGDRAPEKAAGFLKIWVVEGFIASLLHLDVGL